MRILLLSQFYPPVIGGVEIHVRALARGLVARGHQVTVATLADSVLPSDELDDGVQIHRLQGTAQRITPLFTTERHHAPPVPDPEIVLALRRLVGKYSPDIVHAHNWLGRSFVPIRRSSHARYVVTLHDCGRTCAQGRMMYCGESLCAGPDLRRCLRCVRHCYGAAKGPVTLLGNRLMLRSEIAATDLFIPVSTAVARANRLAENGVRYEVVPNFAEDSQLLPSIAADEAEVLPQVPFILQVGDVVADKGVHVLSAAYSRLVSPPPLVLIGRIEPNVRDSLPSGAIALGVQSHALVLEAWRRSLFGTIPSLCLDACPTVTFEAMAASRSVIASDLGGLSDQVDNGVTGILVPPGDSEALRKAMSQLLDEPELAHEMGASARIRFENEYRADVVIGRIVSLYRELLARG
ncbi:MAG: glycosyltransferase family 4 protein [Coriobacteriia bacterium]|nr:glycosyltransferase family 4 protein [Coriobacteriia bacterium]